MIVVCGYVADLDREFANCSSRSPKGTLLETETSRDVARVLTSRFFVRGVAKATGGLTTRRERGSMERASENEAIENRVPFRWIASSRRGTKTCPFLIWQGLTETGS
jgi:hypothetical protein